MSIQTASSDSNKPINQTTKNTKHHITFAEILLYLSIFLTFLVIAVLMFESIKADYAADASTTSRQQSTNEMSPSQ